MDGCSVFTLLRQAHKRVVSGVIETWFGGWTTSVKMHEDCTHYCLFGCRTCDHAMCPKVRQQVHDVSKRALPCGRLAKLGLMIMVVIMMITMVVVLNAMMSQGFKAT